MTTRAGFGTTMLEYFNEFQFGSSRPAQSDAYLLSRIMFSADLHATRYFRVFAEGKSSLATDRDLQGKDSNGFVDTIDLQNALPLPVTSRVYLNVDYASGDGQPGGDVGTFNQLYPLGHAYLGYMDYVGRQNIISPSAGISVSPLRGLTSSGGAPGSALSTEGR